MSLAMNSVQSCPSRGRLVSHLAHGQVCPVCMPDEERPIRCPECRRTVTALGTAIVRHLAGGRGWQRHLDYCPGSGAHVSLAVPVERPVVTTAELMQRARAAEVLRDGAA